jgi:hypothetical protein
LTGAYVWLCTFVGRNDQTAWRSETRFHKEWPVVPSRSRRRRTPREGSAALLCRHGNGGCNEPAQRDGGTRDFAIRFTCWRRRRGLPCTGGEQAAEGSRRAGSAAARARGSTSTRANQPLRISATGGAIAKPFCPVALHGYRTLCSPNSRRD